MASVCPDYRAHLEDCPGKI